MSEQQQALWPQLVSTALVGTQRRSPDATTVPESMTALVPVRNLRTESDLLVAAGALALARRSGFRIIDGIAPPVSASHDDLPLAPPAARMRLRRLLDGSVDVNLVDLWLTLAVDRGLRAPGRDLPNLFRLGRAHEWLRANITSVAGTRGAWLAAQRSDWQWVVDKRAATIEVDDVQAWLEGSLPDRVAYLATERRRDPTNALDLLTTVWPQEPPTERAALLSVLATGIGPQDEQFCEEALIDRRAEVRTVAADLLASLTGSAYANRMTERALACIRVGKRELAVTPPDSCDAAMKRDGIKPKPPAQVGERAWWFEQIVSATTLTAWSRLGLSAADLVARPVADGWMPTLHRGWARAAIRSSDGIWAAALLASGYGRGKESEPTDRTLATSLFPLMPADQVAQAAMRMLTDSKTSDGDVVELLRGCPRPWPRPLAGALLTYLEAQIRAARTTYVSHHLRELATVIVTGLPIDTATASARELTALAASLPDANPMLTNLMETLVTTATTRYQILQEFA